MSRGFKIALGIALAGILCLLVPGAEFSVYLLVGWASFISHVGSRIEVNWNGIALFALVVGVLAAVGHHFSSWLWRSTGHQTRWKPDWTAAGLCVVVLMFAAGMAVTGLAHQVGWLLFGPEPVMVNTGASLPWSPAGMLKSIASAQNDFRANDRDWNHENDYWRKDIAGLYAMKVQGAPLKLIELSTALADAAAQTDLSEYQKKEWLPLPRRGYLVRALRFKDEKDLDPDRFAAAVYPTSLSAGTMMFIISNDNQIFGKAFSGKSPEIYPEDPLQEGWERWPR